MTIEERKQELNGRLYLLERAELEWIESNFFNEHQSEDIEELKIETSELFQEAAGDENSEEECWAILDSIEENLYEIERCLRILSYDAIISCAESVWEEQITALSSDGLSIVFHKAILRDKTECLTID